jgi:hypothetical protein
MEITPEVRRLIHIGSAAHEIRDLLTQQGVGDLRSEGVQAALDGKTSLDEILRVTHSDDFAGPLAGKEPEVKTDQPPQARGAA